MEDGYLMVVALRHTDNSVDGIGFLRTDISGEIIYRRVYDSHNLDWIPRFRSGMAMVDGHFFSTGQIFIEGLHGQVFLMEINPDTSDTLFFLQQGNATQELAGGILPTSDGNFIL